jgi:hypothetical protein
MSTEPMNQRYFPCAGACALHAPARRRFLGGLIADRVNHPVAMYQMIGWSAHETPTRQPPPLPCRLQLCSRRGAVGYRTASAPCLLIMVAADPHLAEQARRETTIPGDSATKDVESAVHGWIDSPHEIEIAVFLRLWLPNAINTSGISWQ